MTRLLIIRHGETIWNNELRFQGHSDIPLSENGRNQARRLAERLAGEKLDAFYASDLSRAYETAAIVAERHKLPVNKIELLRETKFGIFEGKKFSEIAKEYPEVWKNWQRNPRETLIPDGERLDEVAARARDGIRQILERHPDQTIAVVTHGGTIRLILSAALDLDIKFLWHFRQDNTALNIIDYYGSKAIIALVNDISHLDLGFARVQS